jgi:hypothetical protein
MTTIATQQPDALDGAGGGSYDIGANQIEIEASCTGALLTLDNDASDGTALVAANDSASDPCVSLANGNASGVALDIADGDARFASGSLITLLGAGDLPQLAARTYDRVQNLHSGRENGGSWVYSDAYSDGVNGRSGWLQTDKTTAFALIIPISNLVQSGTLTGVTVYLDGGLTAVHGALPDTKPQHQVFKSNITTGVLTQLGSTATDAPASVAAYEAGHSVAVTGLSEVITESHRYMAVVLGESGANSENNALIVHGLVASFSCTLLTPGG